MSKYEIAFDTGTYGLISRYVIPKWLFTQYIAKPSIIYYPGGQVDVGYQSFCDLCTRFDHETTTGKLTVCQDKHINYRMGHPAKICLDCVYWLEYDSGNTAIPVTFKKQIESGYKPRNIDRYRF